MAKAPVHSIIVRFRDLAWFPELNLARQSGDYGKERDREMLREKLASENWWKNVNGTVECDEISQKWCEGRKAEAVKQRHSQWEFYKVTAQQNPGEKWKLDVFEAIFVEESKIVSPKYIGITGNRRASEFFEAQLLRARMVDDDEFTDEAKTIKNPNFGKPLPFDDTVPATVKDYSDPLFRLEEQAKENLGKNQCFFAGTPVDHLLIAKEMLGMGANQNKIRTAFGATAGVKFHGICVLNVRYPKLAIIERMKLTPGNAASKEMEFPKMWINIAKIKHTQMQDFTQRFDVRSTEEYNNKNSTKQGFPKPVLSEKEVELYFANPDSVEKLRDPKMMDKNAIASISNVNDNPISRLTAKAIHDNNPESLKSLAKIATACNYLLTLENDGDNGDVDRLLASLTAIAHGDARNAAFKACFKALGLT